MEKDFFSSESDSLQIKENIMQIKNNKRFTILTKNTTITTTIDNNNEQGTMQVGILNLVQV